MQIINSLVFATVLRHVTVELTKKKSHLRGEYTLILVIFFLFFFFIIKLILMLYCEFMRFASKFAILQTFYSDRIVR